MLTNGAGSLQRDWPIGQPVLISDHINLTGRSPLTGPNPPAPFGSRFVDLTDLYSARLRAVARTVDPELPDGVYVGFHGPHFETPAEIRMAGVVGADLVGMSTVLEAIAARHVGLEVLGISLATNLAAGISPVPLDASDVIAAGDAAAGRLGVLLRGNPGSTGVSDHDLAVVDATVVTMDSAGTVVHGGTVLVDGDTITAVAAPNADDPPPSARRVIDARGAIVVPGLVNAHAHLAMTMFRGLADDVDLDGFLARLLPAEGALLSPATVTAGVRLAIAESLRAGITTALDMYFFPEAAADVAADTGFDLRGGPVFVEFPGADHRRFDARLTWAAELLASTPSGRRWVCPHSTYLLDEPQLRAVGELASTQGARVHVHACETVAELAAVRERHGRTPIEVLGDTGLLGPGTVLAHGVHLDDHDIELIAASGATVSHCPASNQKLASGFARIPDLLAAGVPVALGTDGAASANDLDPWLAMRLTAYPQAARHGVGTLTAADVLAMTTIGGSRAAGDPSIGSIEVGTRADLVVLDASSPALTPSYDAVSTAAYAASRADVRWVVAGGRIVVDDRVLTTIDVDATIAEVVALQPSVVSAAR